MRLVALDFFEIKSHDLAARVTKLKTNHGTINTPTILPVINPKAQVIPASEMKEFGVEAVITLLAIKEQVVPPTINLENPDPECDLDYVPQKARKINLTIALSNSFGFGGTNACLLFRRFKE